MCGCGLRAGLVPEPKNARSSVGRNERERAAGAPCGDQDRWYGGGTAVAGSCGTGRLGGAGRRGPARAVPPGHVVGVTPEGPRRVARPLTYCARRAASDEPVRALKRGRHEVVGREPARDRRVRGAALTVSAPAALQRGRPALKRTGRADQREVLDERRGQRRHAGVELLAALERQRGHGPGGRNRHVASLRLALTPCSGWSA